MFMYLLFEYDSTAPPVDNLQRCKETKQKLNCCILSFKCYLFSS